MLAVGRIWSILIIDSRLASLSCGLEAGCSCIEGVGLTLWACGLVPFFLDFGELFGPVRCKLALVALKNAELATFNSDGGRARKKR